MISRFLAIAMMVFALSSVASAQVTLVAVDYTSPIGISSYEILDAGGGGTVHRNSGGGGMGLFCIKNENASNLNFRVICTDGTVLASFRVGPNSTFCSPEPIG